MYNDPTNVHRIAWTVFIVPEHLLPRYFLRKEYMVSREIKDTTDAYPGLFLTADRHLREQING
jgi:hypothetical protein